MTTRREFLKAAGITAGLTVSGAILSSCSNNALPPVVVGTDGILPNGYRFFALKRSSETLPNGGSIQQLRPDACIDASGRIIYGVVDKSDRIGMYAMRVDLNGANPTVISEERLVVTGDYLDGRRVIELNSYDINRSGHYAVVVKVETEIMVNTTDESGNFTGKQAPMHMQALYGDFGLGLKKVLSENMTNAQGHEFAGMFGDVALHDDGNLIIAANYYHNSGEGLRDVRQGVFALNSRNSSKTELVMSSGAPIAASTAAPSISRFGLLSLHDGGEFVVQANLNPSPLSLQSASEGAMETALLRGNLNTVGEQRLSSGAAANMRIEASSIQSGLRVMSTRASGTSFFGPRLGPSRSFAHVLNNGETHTLLINNRQVLKSGGRSPTGAVIAGITSPQLATDGVSFVTVSTNKGIELIATNGQQSRTILRSGDFLVNDSRPIGPYFSLGYTTTHSDDDGRLVFIVGHDANSQSLVIGIPV